MARCYVEQFCSHLVFNIVNFHEEISIPLMLLIVLLLIVLLLIVLLLIVFLNVLLIVLLWFFSFRQLYQ